MMRLLEREVGGMRSDDSVLAQTCSIGTPTEENRFRGLRLPMEVQSLCHRLQSEEIAAQR